MKINKAIISVSDKEGIVEFAKELHQLGVSILSTGGTAKLLREQQIPVMDISEHTGFPEIMDGRVKTLHPKVHGGILALRENAEHMKIAKEQNIEMIDMVVVNLYPFKKTVEKENVSLEDAIENIDIGGPTMLRSSAKNYRSVTVITDPSDYSKVINEIKNDNEVSLKTRETLAIKVFRHTSEYDGMVDTFLSNRLLKKPSLHLQFYEGQELRYGENSHQKATFYLNEKTTETSVARCEILNGKAMSFNNYVDANAALEVVKDIPAKTPAVSVIKHTNPCGFATGKTAAKALEQAWAGDPISAFGGVIATNQIVDLDFAEFLKGDKIKHYSYMVVNGQYVPQEVPTGKFIEIIIAAGYTDEALEYLKKKSKMLRLLKLNQSDHQEAKTFKHVTGGILVQEKDKELISSFDVVTDKGFPGTYTLLSEFTWVATKHTKSNAIVLGREYENGQFQVIGMGAGQPNRVDSMRKLAVPKAIENLKREFETKGLSGDIDAWVQSEMEKVVLVSDAFFPFDDTVRAAAECGIKYLIQPGGSKRDDDSIKACNELGLAMAFTGLRHFNH